MKKIINQYFVEDYGIIAYRIETGEIVVPFAYGGRYCTKKEFIETENHPNKEQILKLFDDLEKFNI
jgi:hypothetical protein